jgi:alkylglycerol monooxygenase
METYGTVINFVIPIFFALYIIEVYFAWKQNRSVIRSMDSISSFSSGMTNVIKDVLGLSIAIIGYQWLVDKVALVHVGATWAVYLIAFVAVDFQGYWAHRWSHEINFLWNRHIIHHSSEEFNLSCALRQSVSAIINYFTILLLPAALLGVPPEVVAVIGPVHLFLQYWYHTQLIGKLGWLEYIIVTPSQHRVHHAINKEYQDRNYGQIFCLWDRWFGSFQPEMPDVPPVYGVSRPVRTWNPLKINFQHLLLLWKDALRTRNWLDKLRIWFMPTGWRPADVAQQHPVYKIEDVYHFEKYNPPTNRPLVIWSWVQFFFGYFLLIYFLSHVGKIGVPGIFYYGAFMALCIYAYTEMMDRNPYAAWIETFKSLLGLGMVWQMGLDWFGANAAVGSLYTGFAAAYFIISVPVAFWMQASPTEHTTFNNTTLRKAN